MSENGTTYTPRAGSKAEAAIGILQRAGWMSNVDLAAALDVPPSNVGGYLALAQREGVIRTVARDGIAGFALGGTGEPVPPRAKPAPKARQKPRSKSPLAPVDEDCRQTAKSADGGADASVGVLADGTVVVLDGQRLVARIPPEVAARIVALVERLRQ